MQQKTHQHPLYLKKQRRSLVFGTLILVAGCAGMLLPIVPGLVLVLSGLSVLSSQSRLAHRLLTRIRVRYHSAAAPLERFETRLNTLLDLTTHTREFAAVPRGEHGETINAYVEVSEFRAGIAFILHSASGVKDTPFMDMLAEHYRTQGYTVVRFDAYYGLGGEGEYNLFSVTEYTQDLAYVIAWAREQEWWQKPCTFVGHSIGALVAAQYVAYHPEVGEDLVLVAPTVSGASYVSALKRYNPDLLHEWRERGSRTVPHPLTGNTYELSYAFVEDAERYSLLKLAPHIRVPVHVIVSTSDRTAPAEDFNAFTLLCITPVAVETVHVPHTPTTHREIMAVTGALHKLYVDDLKPPVKT